MRDWLWPLLTGVGLLAAWIRFGYFWDDKLDEKHRDAVRDKMLGVMGDQNPAELFIFLFDRVFVPSRRGRPRIGRSIIASCVTLAVMLCVWWAWWPERVDAAFAPLLSPDPAMPNQAYHTLVGLLALGAVAMGTNLFGDYFSLWETRFVLGRMAGARPWLQWTLLAVDSIATYAMFLVGLVIGFVIMWIISFAMPILDTTEAGFLGTLLSFVAGVSGYLFLDGAMVFSDSELPKLNDLFALFLYTALFTSIWLWVFFLGVKLWPRLKKVGNLLNVYVHPLGAAMTLGAVFLGVVVAITVVVWKVMALLISL